jgi:dolichol-phosphate mannosyltransferase
LSQLITIICPVFNEELAIPLFYKRLRAVLDQLSVYRFELIFTNNASTDRSLDEISAIQSKDQTVHCLTLSRNFGYQASLLAGLKHANGDAVVIIDVDCEDPPELILKFVDQWKGGFDIAYGLRGKRQEARVITWCRLLFYRILKLTADSDIILDMAEFSLMSKRVRDAILKSSNTYPFLRAEIAYSGFSKIGVPYNREARIIGKTHYNFFGMFMFAVAGILSISTFPLRIPVYLFPVMLILNLSTMVADCVGYENMFRPMMLLNALYLIAILSSQGLYIARIYKNGIGRAIYVIDWSKSDRRLLKQIPG